MALLRPRPVSRIVLIALAAVAVSACASTRPAPKAAQSASTAQSPYFTAPVFQGDTLASFAERYRVNPNDVLALNSVRQRKSTGRLINGQLKVPAYTRPREERLVPAVQTARSLQPPPQSVQPAVITPQAAPVQTRRASIETRSLTAPSVSSARNASVTANGLDTPSTAAAAAPMVMASRSEPPAAEPSWYDWFVPVTPPVASGADTEQRFLWPVEGRVISTFGDTPAGGRNDGINISVARGTPIRAAESG